MCDAIERFSKWREMRVKKATVRGYDRELRNLCLFLRNPEIEMIQIDCIMEYLNLHTELGWSHNTMIPKCMAIRKFFEYYRHQDFRVLDPWLIPIPRKEYNMPRVTNDEFFQNLLAVIPTRTNDPRHIRNLAIVRLLWDTGARNGEILALDVDDVDVETCKAIIKTEKSRGSRPVRQMHWGAEANNALVDWLIKRKELEKKGSIPTIESALFVSVCSQTVGQRFSIRGVGEMLRRYCNKAEIPYQNAHSFRHSKAHRILNQGGSAADVQNILGHASLASSSVYTQMYGKELEDVAKRFLGDGEAHGRNFENSLDTRQARVLNLESEH